MRKFNTDDAALRELVFAGEKFKPSACSYREHYKEDEDNDIVVWHEEGYRCTHPQKGRDCSHSQCPLLTPEEKDGYQLRVEKLLKTRLGCYGSPTLRIDERWCRKGEESLVLQWEGDRWKVYRVSDWSPTGNIWSDMVSSHEIQPDGRCTEWLEEQVGNHVSG